MSSEAEGLADLGLWQDAWDALESLPAEDRAEPAALRVRMRCCPGVGAWEIGEHLARVLRDGGEEDREVAARFYHQLAVFHARVGNREAAEGAIKSAVDAWPDIRIELIEGPVLAEEIW
ncbi:hypothetical protein [Haloferula sp. A504]|uniref:hypothetical protein n=1 Tax=Haloferula sp. A504 TaxID=3373601 RepID=UPI0031C9600E|nr:hypothetical protein [Verrucomicrobiaceae bacterium E54]